MILQFQIEDDKEHSYNIDLMTSWRAWELCNKNSHSIYNVDFQLERQWGFNGAIVFTFLNC